MNKKKLYKKAPRRKIQVFGEMRDSVGTFWADRINEDCDTTCFYTIHLLLCMYILAMYILAMAITFLAFLCNKVQEV